MLIPRLDYLIKDEEYRLEHFLKDWYECKGYKLEYSGNKFLQALEGCNDINQLELLLIDALRSRGADVSLESSIKYHLFPIGKLLDRGLSINLSLVLTLKDIRVIGNEEYIGYSCLYEYCTYVLMYLLNSHLYTSTIQLSNPAFSDSFNNDISFIIPPTKRVSWSSNKTLYIPVLRNLVITCEEILKESILGGPIKLIRDDSSKGILCFPIEDMDISGIDRAIQSVMKT